MNMIKQLLGGVIGGVLGALIWALVVHFTGYEVGFVAWFVGIATGVGVASMSPHRDAASGVLAGVLALVAIGAGKVSVNLIQYQEYRGEATSDDAMIATLADEVYEQHAEAGVDYSEWFYDLDESDDMTPADWYPPEVWGEAQDEWMAMSEPDRDAMRAEVEEEMAQYMTVALIVGTLLSLGIFDFLWVFLAIGSAYKIASDPGRVAPGEQVFHEFGADDAVADDAAPVAQAPAQTPQPMDPGAPTHPMLRMGMQQSEAAASRPPMRRLSDPAPESDQAEAA